MKNRPDRGARRGGGGGTGAERRRPDGRREGTALRPRANAKAPAGRPPRGPNRSKAHGPKRCPMCGEAVADLRRHMHERHDDAASHPRE